MDCLEAMCGRNVGVILSNNGISPERFQMELARLRIKELEREAGTLFVYNYRVNEKAM